MDLALNNLQMLNVINPNKQTSKIPTDSKTRGLSIKKTNFKNTEPMKRLNKVRCALLPKNLQCRSQSVFSSSYMFSSNK